MDPVGLLDKMGARAMTAADVRDRLGPALRARLAA